VDFQKIDFSKMKRVKELIIKNANQQIELSKDILIEQLRRESPKKGGHLLSLGIITYSINSEILSFLSQVQYGTSILNLSVYQYHQPHLSTKVFERFAEHSIAPRRLTIDKVLIETP
jgi:hypothetical protein